MKTSRLLCPVLLAGAAGVSFPLIAQSDPASGPIARYDMRAGTISGFSGGAGGLGAAAAIFGGGDGGQAQHELHLRLGSSIAADNGRPRADHFMPSGARLGRSVVLATPGVEPAHEEWRGERPKGRLLLYWGCGEHAPQGQPVVIDFAQAAADGFPPGVWTTSIPADFGPTLSNSRTFGHWPAEDGKSARPDSSLIGAHRVAGNYSPEIGFTLSKDFMAALQIRTAPGAGNSSVLTWSAIPDATGYIVTLIGGKQDAGGQMGDMVMWTSSANRHFGGGLTDWLSPSQAAALVRDETLLSPETTTCTVPAEVVRDTPDYRLGTLAAFGPEETFAYPPRPDDPRATWRLEWTARIRHRSTTNWIETQGMTMGTADSRMAGQAQADQSQQEAECKPRRRGGLLGGAIGGAIGAAVGAAVGGREC